MLIFAFLGWSTAWPILAPRLGGRFWAERAYEHAYRDTLVVSAVAPWRCNAWVKPRGAFEQFVCLGNFESDLSVSIGALFGMFLGIIFGYESCLLAMFRQLILVFNL